MSEIDPALAIELENIERQKPIHDLIERGDSEIQKCYNNATVLLTGGSGFIGKHLMEKLLRACNIKKLYMLNRSKRGYNIQQRLEKILSNPLYDVLREKQPNFADRIIPIEGDIALVGLGLSEEGRAILTKEVNIIIHAAATVNFDEPLRKATLINVRGTREMLQLAKECKHLKKFVHVSTAFTHATKNRVDKEVLEQFYDSPVPPEALITFAEQVDEARFNSITAELIEGWPNTYTFTKAVGEELVRTTAGDLPVCVVRPPIVSPSYLDPKPGWLETSTLAGPSGIYLAIGLGVLNVFCVNEDIHLAITPIDYVNNAIIASAWDTPEHANDENKIPVYTVARRERYILWKFLGEVLRNDVIQLSTPLAVWRCEMFETKIRWLYVVLSWFLHYIPAYCLDVVFSVIGKKPKEISSFGDVYRKVDKLAGVYSYFLSNEWNFRDDNVQAMYHRMSPTDQKIFNCDLMTINQREYVIIWGLGLRRYILKDGLQGTMEARKKQKIFRILNYIVMTLYAYLIWFVLSRTFMFIFDLIF